MPNIPITLRRREYDPWYPLLGSLRHAGAVSSFPWDNILYYSKRNPVVALLRLQMDRLWTAVVATTHTGETFATDPQGIALFETIIAICREMDALETLTTEEQQP